MYIIVYIRNFYLYLYISMYDNEVRTKIRFRIIHILARRSEHEEVPGVFSGKFN